MEAQRLAFQKIFNSILNKVDFSRVSSEWLPPNESKKLKQTVRSMEESVQKEQKRVDHLELLMRSIIEVVQKTRDEFNTEGHSDMATRLLSLLHQEKIFVVAKEELSKLTIKQEPQDQSD